MERKTITTKKETSIVEKQETKTEVSDSGYTRRTKSEIFTEYVITETELVLDDADRSRSRAGRESFPELSKKRVRDGEAYSGPEALEDFSSTSENCNVSEVNQSSNSDETLDGASVGSDEFFDSLKHSENDILTGNVKRSDGNPVNDNEHSPPENFPSSLNGYVKRTAASVKTCENDTEGEESDTESKRRKNTPACDDNSAKCIKCKVSSPPCPESCLNEELSEMHSILNSLALHLPENKEQITNSRADHEDNVIILKMRNKTDNKGPFRDNDVYSKGDSHLISSSSQKQNKKKEVILDRQSLDRSVSYLVKCYENIKNVSPNNTNKTGEYKVKEIEKYAGDINNRNDVSLTSNSGKKTFKIKKSAKEMSENAKDPFIKQQAFISQLESNKDSKNYTKSTEVKTPDVTNTEEVSSKVNNGFCVVKYERPETATDNTKSNLKQAKRHCFTPMGDLKDGSSDNDNAPNVSFISPRFALKKTRPHFCHPVLSHVQLHIPKESDDIPTFYSSDETANANELGKQNVKKDASTDTYSKSSYKKDASTNTDSKSCYKKDASTETDSKSSYFFTPKANNVRGKETVSSGDDGYSTNWTFSDKIHFSFAVMLFTILLAIVLAVQWRMLNVIF